jgi:uncharacterized protein YndB with AHSA1/START domain
MKYVEIIFCFTPHVILRMFVVGNEGLLIILKYINMNKVILERSFSTPIEKVWEALTVADTLKKWWCPPGMESPHISVDLKKDGIFGYCFSAPDGKEFWGRGVYQIIEQPKFLSFLDTFTDSDGNPVAPSYYGMPEEKIVESLVEFSLTMENGITTMKMVGDNPHDDSLREDMEKGWNGMFDKLEVLLK